MLTQRNDIYFKQPTSLEDEEKFMLLIESLFLG